MADEKPTAQIIQFPRQLRIVPVAADEPATAAKPPTLVDYDGRAYRLADLMGQLTPRERTGIEGIAPATAQASWDEAVRRWPALAAEIVAGCKVVD